MRVSPSFLDVGPRPITLPLLAPAYRAPLASALQPDFALWLKGRTGLFMSTLAVLEAALDRHAKPM